MRLRRPTPNDASPTVEEARRLLDDWLRVHEAVTRRLVAEVDRLQDEGTKDESRRPDRPGS